MTNDKSDKTAADKTDFLKLAHERFKVAMEAETQFRLDSLDDWKFRAGEQWPQQIKAERDMDGRPCLVINRIPQFIRQVTNDQRQNRPSIKVQPVDDQADRVTAKINQGLIRHIEYDSNADVAYDTAFDAAVTGGRGWFRIVTDYSDPMSFDQDIQIKAIPDCFQVVPDPMYREPDGSDLKFGFVFQDLSEEEFNAQYPNSKMSKMEDWTSVGMSSPGWASQDICRVAEYFYIEHEEITLCQLSNGEIGDKATLDESKLGDVTIVAERKSLVPKVKWAKINGVEVLEETEIAGQWIPLIPVHGEQQIIDGQRTFLGLVRNAKDPQRMYNYWTSSETETIALAPRAPWIGAEGQFEGHENQWRDANRKNFAFLQYKPISLMGQPVGPPQRNVFEPPVAAITQAKMFSSDDLKATTGVYDAALGAQGNEKSGIAIQRRNLQSQTSNFHFMDNLTRSLRHGGRIILSMIPTVYDTKRVTRILGEGDEQDIVQLNAETQYKGETKLFNMTVGKYDVVVETGPSFATKRQEASQSMMDFTKTYPQFAQLCGDLIAKNMDWPGAQEISDRLKKALPPGIADDPNNQKPIPPQAQAQIQQMQGMIDQLTKAVNSAHDEIDQKTRELQSKERIEFAKMQVDLEKKLADIEAANAQLMLKTEIAVLQGRLNKVGMNEPIESQTNSNGTGSEGAAMPNPNQQPTGGLPPGPTVGVQP